MLARLKPRPTYEERGAAKAAPYVRGSEGKNGGAGRNCTAVRKNVPTGVYVRSVVYFLVPAVKTMQNQPGPAPGNLVATIQSNQWPPAR